MAEVQIGMGKSARRAYGFDEIAVVPSRRTRDPEEVSVTWQIDAYRFEAPIVSSAMDSVVSPDTAVEIGRLGGLGVLDLEGLWTRYDDPKPMLDEIRRTVAAFRERTGFTGEFYIRLQISRGGGAIGLDVALAGRPEFVLLVQPCPTIAVDQLRNGLRLSIATGLRRNSVESLNPAWKTGNYLNNLLCLREARARGADEVVILNLAGEVTEAAVSNIGFVREGILITPPLSAGILVGITRGLLLEKIAASAGVAIREAPVRPEDLVSMHECFLLSSTKDVTPVGAIDDVKFRVAPDTVTMRLKQAFGEFAQRYADGHPELTV